MKREEYKRLSKKNQGANDISEATEEEEDLGSYKEALIEVLHHRVFWILITLMVLIGGALFNLIRYRDSLLNQDTAIDYNQVISDVNYTVTLKEEEDGLVGYVVSEDLEETDAVTLSDVIQETEDAHVRVYVFEEELSEWIEPDFYTDGLRYSVTTYPDNRYETRNFYPLPSIEGDIDSVKEWDLKTEESFVDKNDVLHVDTHIPPLVTTEDTVAFLKEMSGTIQDLNDNAYTNILFNIKSGVSEMTYSANHPTVISDVQLYQMEQLSKGE